MSMILVVSEKKNDQNESNQRFLCDWIVTSWRENNNFEATLPVGALFSVCGEDLGGKGP